MRLSLTRRLATPFVAAGAAMTLMFGGAGIAAAQETPPPPAWTGDRTADNLRWSLSLTAVNGAAVDRAQSGVNVVHPGDTVTYTSQIWKASGIGRYITGMRQIQPAGLTYLSHTISKQSNISNGGAAGVTASCTGGGCNSVPVLGNKGYLDNVTFAVTYQVPATQAIGDFNAGFVFDVYAFGSQQGANPAGAWLRVVAPNVATTTTLTAPATAVTGTPVDLTATVGPANSVGTVQFKDGANNIGGPVTVSGGVATLPHTFDTVGAHSITAAFTAGAGFVSSTSTASTVNVAAPAVATTTDLTVPATALTGTAVDLTATVGPADAVGSVQFKDGGVNIGSPVAVSGGVATLSHTFDTVASHSITAEFVAGAGFVGSTSAAHAVEVSAPLVTTTTDLAVPATALTGTAVDLTATVGPADAVGSVQFKDGGVNIGSPVAVSGGVATLSHTFDTVASHSITAEFVAGAGFVGSTSAAHAVEVSAPIVETSTVLSAPADAKTGTSVDLTATVTPADAVGSVQFKDGDVNIGSPVAVSGGVATLAHTFDTVAQHSITAEFVAGTGFSGSTSGASVVDVTAPAADTSTVLSAPADAKTGTSVDLTATVTPADAVGSVQFKDGDVNIGSPVTVSGGVATLAHTFDTVAQHSITAVFSGGAGFNDSTSTASVVDVTAPAANDVETSTTLDAIGSVEKGDTVEFKATVNPATANGAVQFKVAGVAVGSPVAVVDGVATASHTFDEAGTFAITAEFVGVEGFTNSAAAPQSVTVPGDTDPGPGTGSAGSLASIFGS
ncbi:beta strand repeat-containing protein [Rhodococcus kronopolitis]|uniref:Beta strand repeat-containing protein n=1 Tax=Rhodococcus kronopolitis TaxID=1460226 RepID=A0ABV9FX52_9NOCA